MPRKTCFASTPFVPIHKRPGIPQIPDTWSTPPKAPQSVPLILAVSFLTIPAVCCPSPCFLLSLIPLTGTTGWLAQILLVPEWMVWWGVSRGQTGPVGPGAWREKAETDCRLRLVLDTVAGNPIRASHSLWMHLCIPGCRTPGKWPLFYSLKWVRMCFTIVICQNCDCCQLKSQLFVQLSLMHTALLNCIVLYYINLNV